MNLTEFRIGNLIYRIGRHTEIHMPIPIAFKIIEIHTFKVLVVKQDENPALLPKWTEVDTNDVAPILLSPEILEKCGFEMPSKVLTLNNDWFLCDNYDGFYIQIERQAEEIYICERVKIECKYLHQLQNIYYSLTGEELQITLP